MISKRSSRHFLDKVAAPVLIDLSLLRGARSADKLWIAGQRTILLAVLLLLVLAGTAGADTTSSISANFNGTAISAGDTIWFTSVLKPSGLGSSSVTVFIRKSTISFTANGSNYSVPTPDSDVTFSPTTTTATVSFDATNNIWKITVPSSGLAGNTLLDAVQFPVLAGGLPGGIQNVTWQASFSTDTAGVSLQWKWGAAVYSSFNADYNNVGVKPVDDNSASEYKDSDHAGTPENYKSYVIGGATGGGGSNWTGGLSGTANLSVPVAQAPTANPGGPYNAYVAQALSFNGNSSTDPNGYALNYLWNFGDGTTATGASPSHTYSSAGTFTVTLKVDDGRNITGTSSTSANITFLPPPTISATISPAPNASGWNNTSVTVTFTCSDPNVGIKTCPAPITVTTTGANQVVQGTAIDNAGVSATISPTVNIDETAPTITASASPAADTYGWNNSNVTVTFQCADSLSGVAQCPSPVLVSANGANQAVSGTAIDKAGNTASTSISLNIEQTPPSITASVSPQPNALNWNRTDVTVNFTCTQSTAPITSCSPAVTVGTEGANQLVTGAVTDEASLSNNAKTYVNIAKTPPSISYSISPAPNANNWNNTGVTVTFTCTQTTAPLAACPQPVILTTEGANQAITGTVTDIAGNSTSITAHVNIALTAPTITYAVSPQPNENGWNNSSVVVTFTCTQTTAPIASCTSPQTVATEGANHAVPGSVTDLAGNSATVTAHVNIATTAPAITYSVSPPPDSYGWNNSPVTVTFTCTQTTAPIATCPPPQTFSNEAADQQLTGTVTDIAGDQNSVTASVNIALTPPLIVALASPLPNANGWNNSNVTVSFTCTQTASPLAACPAPQIVSAEGANQQICGQAVDDAGNQSQPGCVTLSIDKTSPTISYTITPAPDAHGIVTLPPGASGSITFSCLDSLSGVASCPQPISITAPGAAESFTGTATDLAGNSSAPIHITLNVQSGPLTLAAILPSQPNSSGWYNTTFAINYECVGGVPPVQCASTAIVSTEGANQSISATVTDAIGQTASATTTVSLDTTPPSVTYSISPPPDGNGVNYTPVTVSFNCSDSLSGVATCPVPISVNTDGTQTVSATATDVAGNSSVITIPITLQLTPLSVAYSLLPQPNAAGWNKSPVTVTFQCAGGVAPVQCPSPQSVSVDGISKVVGTAIDATGRSVVATAIVNLDQIPPSLNVISPANGGNVTTQQVSITGLVTDALSGLAGVSCNGTPATITGNAFNCATISTPGTNLNSITAIDVAGNTLTFDLTLVYAYPLTVQISNPTTTQLFSANPITVTGTVGNSSATVVVGSVPAIVTNGTFTASGVALREGKNFLTATATTSDGGVGSDTVTVFLDTTPPVVHIDNPVDGAILSTPQIDVTGNVNDMVSGTVNSDQVSVTVNGVNAGVTNRSFAAHSVLLVPGTNTILATATDRAGNVSQHQVRVILLQTAGQQILSSISGNAQSAAVATILPQPLVVKTVDGLGRPIPNLSLNFAVIKSDGQIISGQTQARSLSVQTDMEGQASVQFRLGTRVGAGINQVGVSAPGFVGQVVFSADSTIGTAAMVRIVSGDQQTGVIGVPLSEPLVAITFDAQGNPAANVPVTFTVESGGGTLNGQSTITQNTDSDGKAYAILVAGQQEGINNNVVVASIPTGDSVTFSSSGVVSGPPAQTSVSGIVLDNANQPIPNVRASIKGTSFAATTNSSGQFTIASAPVGDIVLFVDGSTATTVAKYPTLSFQMVDISGIDNNLGHPIYLPPIDVDNSVVVGDAEVQLTMKGVPGVLYTIAPNSATFPDGSHTGTLTLSQVHADKVPMTPPNGTAPRLVATLQPAGVVFNPPIKMQLPNTDGLAPGQVVEIFSFHHDIEQFVVEGTARVSEDGAYIITDPGFGLTVSGWHGGNGTPPPTTCTSSCDNGCFVGASCVLGFCHGTPVTIDSAVAQADGNDPDYTTPKTSVQFSVDATTNCSLGDLQYNWDFGDGSTSTDHNPTHAYTNPNSYVAQVNVTCAKCSSVSQWAKVRINVMQLQINSPCTDNPGLCSITNQPAMPAINSITPTVLGLSDTSVVANTQFQWRSHVEHDAEDCRFGPAGVSYAAPDIQSTITGPGQFLPDFAGNYGSAVYGGDFTLYLKATIGGVDLSTDTSQQPNNDDEHIRGTNPTPQQVYCALPHDVLRKVSCHESQWIQFVPDSTGVPNACPNWSHDLLGGAGIMQVTPVSLFSGSQDLWNWTTNVADGIGVWNSKFRQGDSPDTYPAEIANTSVFQNAVIKLNRARIANGLRAINVTVPFFKRGANGVADPATAPDWSGGWNDTNVHQYERDAIQAYNGYCDFTGQYGTRWHQYQLQTVNPANQESDPVITVNENTLTGSVNWVWIPSGNRPDRCGTSQFQIDSAYVDHVLATPAACHQTVSTACQ